MAINYAIEYPRLQRRLIDTCDQFKETLKLRDAEIDLLKQQITAKDDSELDAYAVALKGKDAEIERLEKQVKYWQEMYEVMRDRYEPNWGNGL